MPLPKTKPPRIQIQDPWPAVDCGRYPAKRSLGDTVEVWADIFRDGHDQLGAAVRYRSPSSEEWREAPMRHVDSDRWAGSFVVDELGRWSFTVAAWVDRFASWREELRRKVDGGQDDVSSELAEGAALMGYVSLDAPSGLATTATDRSEPILARKSVVLRWPAVPWKLPSVVMPGMGKASRAA